MFCLVGAIGMIGAGMMWFARLCALSVANAENDRETSVKLP